MAKAPKKGLRFETVGSIVAMIVGACALYITWDQARVMRAQQHAAVWPILTIDRATDTIDDRFLTNFNISNAGVGPAILKSAELKTGETQLASWAEYREKLPETMRETSSVSHTSINGRVLAAADGFQPYGLSWVRDDITRDDFKAVQFALSDIVLEICYCSVFDRCWTTSSAATSSPERIETCPSSEIRFK
jgi:hypothetical protein